MISTLDDPDVTRELWQSALETISPLELRPACARYLSALIAMAVERMVIEDRLTPNNLVVAHENLTELIHLMKIESVFLGHSDRLDVEAFHAAHRNLERRAMLTPFSLWPFWPNAFVINK